MRYLLLLLCAFAALGQQNSKTVTIVGTNRAAGIFPASNGTNFIPAYITNGSGATVSYSGGVYTISSSAGGGNVSNFGTPVVNQLGIWASATTIGGSAGLTFDGTTLTATAFAGPLSGNATTANALSTGRTLAITGDLGWTSPSFDGSGNVTAAGTLATVNSNVGSFGNGSFIPTITVNGKGLITAITTNAVTAGGTGDVVGPASATDNAIVRFDTTTGKLIQNSAVAIDDSGNITGVGDLTAANIVLSSPVGVTAGGTGRATSTTAYGLLAAGTTATGAHQTLAAGATTEILVGGGASALPVWTTATGTGAPVRGTSPTITLGNGTGLPISTGVSGLGTGIATALAVNTGSAGAPVLFNGAMGTPTSGTVDVANVILRQNKSLFLMRPDYGDGAGAVPQTNSYVASGLMHYTFSGSAETNVNYVVYETIVPTDIDTSVAMTATFAFVSGGTDADDVTFHITYALGASGTALPTGTSIATSPIAITKTPTTPASGDVQVSAATTLTSWAGSMTAGTPLLIRVARLNTSNDDTARDMSLLISYGSTQ